ncbi:MAG: acetyl-CoA decarbonylase/synthase complex subunit delta [Eubacteriales bacterium]|nr:acetyl-CoA decarbonylase/synthase complex subunit delta [Eubacteriales bacterium]
MAFNPKKQAYNASINAVTLGTGEKSIVVGGENVLPFYTFDAPIANSPKIALEISDKGVESLQTAGMKAAFEGCATVADMAKKAEEIEGVSAICLHFESADPNGENKSVEDCVAMAKEVADATALPIIIMGCKNIEKDAEIFSKCSEALQGKNIVVLSAREEDYKTVGASAGMAYNQKVGAESAVDINLAKQLNVLLSQLGVPAQSILMNLGSSCAGYGYEYLSSTLDRVKAAALAQNDAQLQMPIVTPISTETWNVKEAMLSEEEAPEWGNVEERGIEMEITTAAACLTSGSDVVIMKHPAAIKTIAQFIDSLM